MIMNKLIASVFFVFLLTGNTVAFDCEDYPRADKIDITVSASVSENDGGFTYSYILSSLPTSIQETDFFIVKYFAHATNGLIPGGWTGKGRDDEQRFTWYARNKKHNIKPGETLGGYGFESEEIPSIVDYYAMGWIPLEDLPIVPEEETPEEPCYDIFTGSVKGRTLGPTAPPAELKPVGFITNLIKMKEEAYTLGWITDKGIEIGLDQKLENIKKKLEQGNTGAAKNILNAFINEVEAQGCESYETECPKGKHLKPEAYALLKYNAEYLIENLK